MEETTTLRTFPAFAAEQKKTKRMRTCEVLGRNPDGTVSILVDDIPWCVSPETLEKIRPPTSTVRHMAPSVVAANRIANPVD